ncbi:proteasome subunit alpha type-6, partial [Nannochloropsis oceanica]
SLPPSLPPPSSTSIRRGLGRGMVGPHLILTSMRRLWDYLTSQGNDMERYVLRSKGFFWLATRGKEMGIWSQVGSSFSPRGGGRWWCETAQSEWPEDEEGKEDVRVDFWEEEEEGEGGRVGDKRQEVALIGVKVGGRDDVKTRVVRALDACLMTEEEWREGGREGGWEA